MRDDVKKIGYYILQDEYLKRRNVVVDENDLKQVINEFPSDWFLYSFDDRIKFITLALKNNLNIKDVVNNSNKVMEEKK